MGSSESTTSSPTTTSSTSSTSSTEESTTSSTSTSTETPDSEEETSSTTAGLEVIGDVPANEEDDARGNEEKTLDDEYAQSVNTESEEKEEHNHGHGMVIGGLAVVLIAGLALATHYRLTNARMPRKHVHAQVPSNIAFEESEEEEE